MVLVNSCGVTSLTVTHIELPTWRHWTRCWGEIHTIDLCEPAPARHPSLPLSSVWPKPISEFISSSVKWANNSTLLIGLIHVKNSLCFIHSRAIMVVVTVAVKIATKQNLRMAKGLILTQFLGQQLFWIKCGAFQSFLRHYAALTPHPPRIKSVSLCFRLQSFSMRILFLCIFILTKVFKDSINQFSQRAS